MPGKPRRQGILPFQVQVTDKSDALTSRAGLPLVAETMRALGVPAAVTEHMKLQQRDSGLTDYQKLESVVVLMAAGGDCYDDMRVLQADEGLQRLIGYELPSPDAVRTYANAFHDEGLIQQAKDKRPRGTVAYIPSESELLAGLAEVNVALCQAVAARGKATRATLDHDATIQESHKQQAQAHDKGGRGYQPACVYWAEQDRVMGDEYRDGNVPAGMDNLPLIRRAFGALPASIVQRYFRADSACYEQAVLKWLADDKRAGGPAGPIGFSISADMTPELRGACEAVAAERWELVKERADETLYCADVEFAPGDWPKKLRFCLFNLAGKISTHAGSLVLCISKVAEQIVGLIAARTKLLELLPQPA